MPTGLTFGPDLPPPPKFKKTKGKRKMMVKSRSEGERDRKRARAERMRKREERLLMRAQRREEEKLRRAERGEPVVTKVKAKRAFTSHHGAEQVDATILKLLGRSQRSHKKMAPKSKVKKVEEVAAPTWRHGMREQRNEKKTSATEKMGKKIRLASKEKVRRADEKSKAKADASGEIVISSEQQNLDQSFSRKESKDGAAEEQQPKVDVHQVVPTVNVGPDYEADELDWAEEKQSKLVPIADVGPDYEADGGLCGSGDGAAELAWPLPIQAPLEPMPPCMEFYQVRRQ